jgi:hypothetical protein
VHLMRVWRAYGYPFSVRCIGRTILFLRARNGPPLPADWALGVALWNRWLDFKSRQLRLRISDAYRE